MVAGRVARPAVGGQEAAGCVAWQLAPPLAVWIGGRCHSSARTRTCPPAPPSGQRGETKHTPSVKRETNDKPVTLLTLLVKRPLDIAPCCEDPTTMRSARSLLLLGWCLPAGSLSLLARPHSLGRKRAPHPRASESPPAEVDVAVIGGGPAAYTIAALLSRDEHSVALIDPAPDGEWPNNYGSWRVEWEVRRLRHRQPPPPRHHTCGSPRVHRRWRSDCRCRSCSSAWRRTGK